MRIPYKIPCMDCEKFTFSINAFDEKKLDEFGDETTVDKYTPVNFEIEGDYIYFKNAETDSQGAERGFHRLYRFNMTSNVTVMEDILDGKLDSNGYMEILDFTVGDGWVYFTGFDMMFNVVCGKVNPDTGEYVPINIDYKLSDIEVY